MQTRRGLTVRPIPRCRRSRSASAGKVPRKEVNFRSKRVSGINFDMLAIDRLELAANTAVEIHPPILCRVFRIDSAHALLGDFC